MILLVTLLACTLPSPPEPMPEHAPLIGRGWALRAPEGARVRAEGDALSVDAPDGRRWFDASWHDVDAEPRGLAWAWAAQRCAPMQWDDAATPLDGVWGSGGICSVEGRRYWAFAVVERHAHGALLTTFVADQAVAPYELAWVDFVGSALSLTAGDAPLDTPSVEEIRELVRTAAAEEVPVERSRPVPGGGVLSTRVHERLGSVYRARRASPPPRDLQR